jgi:hypothetical protein
VHTHTRPYSPPLARKRQHHAAPPPAPDPPAPDPLRIPDHPPLDPAPIEALELATCPLHTCRCSGCGRDINAGSAWWLIRPTQPGYRWLCYECGYALALYLGIYRPTDPPPPAWLPQRPLPTRHPTSNTRP